MLILLNIESVRLYGAALLTSAGVAGIIIGFAAQKTLANLLAGFQIAFTQPIKIDDPVVVEGEWGWIDEINLTYVVIRIWDWRRLIVLITYFVEKPFQNWTRVTADLLGSVFLNVDYTVPLQRLREEFDRVLNESQLWDKTANVLQVTDSTETSMQILMLMSARNSPQPWDLRCEVREKMIDFIQRHYPESLPRSRTEVTGLKTL
jgi:small-conductance mechanosensitive channel